MPAIFCVEAVWIHNVNWHSKLFSKMLAMKLTNYVASSCVLKCLWILFMVMRYFVFKVSIVHEHVFVNIVVFLDLPQLMKDLICIGITLIKSNFCTCTYCCKPTFNIRDNLPVTGSLHFVCSICNCYFPWSGLSLWYDYKWGEWLDHDRKYSWLLFIRRNLQNFLAHG